MKTLVLDTETNGLPKALGLEAQPDMMQLAAILFEDERPVAHVSCFTNPELHGGQLFIPKERFFRDAGITVERVTEIGLSYKVALGMFNNMVRRADRAVAHNMVFDARIISAAYVRSGSPNEHWEALPKFCTMETLTPIMKLEWGSRSRYPGGKQYKWPSLMEAYKFTVDAAGFEGAHDAMVDVIAAGRILEAIERKGHVMHEFKEVDW